MRALGAFSIVLACVFACLVVSSCTKDEIVPTPISVESSDVYQDNVVTLDSSSFLTRGGEYCSFPYEGSELSGWAWQSRSLARDQNSDKKYYFRASTATYTNGLICLQIRSKVTNNSSVPIKFRAVGVTSNFWGQEDYVLLDGCYTLGNGQSQVIEFNDDEPLYSWNGSSYDREYTAVMFEIVVPSRSQTASSLTTVSVTAGVCSSSTGTWNCVF
ncbi:MAG: hypothetical protein LBG59_08895 [Candidatus Peribacteria bacterium]|nr:hypothetical protein [Candidatus Peribacteria bacterium]